MALNNENSGIPATMLVGPTGYNNYPMLNNGFGGFGGDFGWLVILFLFGMMGGWGNGGFGGGYDFPWLLAGQAGINANTNAGFDNASVMGQLSGIQSSISNGFANAEVANCNRATDALQTAYNNQIASMNQAFAAQTALDNHLDTLTMSLQNCCCENRAGIADVKYTIATENCADRYEAAQNTRDIIENANRNNQAILDKLCALEIDAKNDKISDLERQLTMANLAASQTAQTARLLSDNAAQTVALEQYLNPTPVPAYVVQNPNCCANNYGCGCGGFNGTF